MFIKQLCSYGIEMGLRSGDILLVASVIVFAYCWANVCWYTGSPADFFYATGRFVRGVGMNG